MFGPKISEIQFNEIQPVWTHELWPGRTSPVERCSAIDRLGQISMELMDQETFFWKAHRDSKIVGVIGAQLTGNDELRSRGLWVSEPYRGQGIASSLVKQVFAKGLDLKCKVVWTLARSTALPFYKKMGFEVTLTSDQYEFGPHYIVEKIL